MGWASIQKFTEAGLKNPFLYQTWAAPKNLGGAPFRKMPEAGLKITQKGLKTRFLSKCCRDT